MCPNDQLNLRTIEQTFLLENEIVKFLSEWNYQPTRILSLATQDRIEETKKMQEKKKKHVCSM